MMDELILARIGSQGPHVLSVLIGGGVLAVVVYRLRPGVLASISLAIFGWQLEEGIFAYTLFTVRQFQGYPGLSYIWGYVQGGSLEITALALFAGVYFFHSKMKLSPLWLGFAGVAAIWIAAGVPTSLSTGTSADYFPLSVPVALLEELWVLAFSVAFYDTFRYKP